MNKIRILMVDDHSLFRESLGRLLQSTSEFEVVGQCSTISESMALLAETGVDVVLLDFDLGEEQGFSFFSEMKKRRINAKVLMVTAGMSDRSTMKVMEAGASGVFLKHSSLEQLLTAVHQVANGEVWLDTGALRSLIDGRNASSESTGSARPLTVRQSEVMRGILDGLSNKEISLKLNSSESAIKAVIQELFRKAGVKTRSQLVRIAIERHSSDWLETGKKD
jgi:DNA-binding NarL/FixJ family response regulator